VLVVAGEFKRGEPDKLEDGLLFRALRDFNYPKIAAIDLAIFDGLLGDLFPGIEMPRKIDPQLEDAVKKAVDESKLTPHPTFL
jgi:dynein heavy chain